MKVYLQNNEGKEVCFKHAVQRVMKNERVDMNAYDDFDCGQSGCWWIGGCVDCESEEAKDNGN